jgi:glycosyltransferase involved in cell wall biosynthesis
MPDLPWLALPPPKGGWELPRYVPFFLYNLLKVQGLRVQAREELRNARAMNAILANSLFSRESILRAYGLDAKVCYLGVDTELFSYRSLPSEEYVVGIGAFVFEKNIELIIRAMAKVRPPRPRIVWIGNVAAPAYLEKLRRLAGSLGVDFEPKTRIGDEELVDTLNRAAMMVYAPRLEPFGFAPLEANACGLPVVAVAEGGVRETIVDGVNGILVEHDPRAMAAAIELLLRDQAHARKLGETGRRRTVEKWSLGAATDRLERRLIDVIGKAHEL